MERTTETRAKSPLRGPSETSGQTDQAPSPATGEAGQAGAAAGERSRVPQIPVPERATIHAQEDLDRVIVEHAKWVRDVLDPTVEVAFGRANLSGLDLTSYVLMGAELSGANLAGAKLEGVDLSRANLTTADLRGTCLVAANLAGAKLTRAKIDGADLRGADLTGATLTGLDLSKAILKSPAPKEKNNKAAATTTEQGAAEGGEAAPSDAQTAEAAAPANAKEAALPPHEDGDREAAASSGELTVDASHAQVDDNAASTPKPLALQTTCEEAEKDAKIIGEETPSSPGMPRSHERPDALI